MTLLDALKRARSGQATSIKCPAHDDRSPSLSVRPAGPDGWVRLKCFGGCEREAILAAEGLAFRDLGPDRATHTARPLRASRAHVQAQSVDLEKSEQRRLWPAFEHPTDLELRTLSELRGIGIGGLRLAAARGILRFSTYKSSRTWVVTDSAGLCAQGRRLDGKPWNRGHKAETFPGSISRHPVGVAALTPEHRSVLLCEGAPDLLAAFQILYSESREADSAAVAMLGANASIRESALHLFEGRRIRICEHLDSAGSGAGLMWFGQLHPHAESVDRVRFNGLVVSDGTPVNDLNDVLHVDADQFDEDRWLWNLAP